MTPQALPNIAALSDIALISAIANSWRETRNVRNIEDNCFVLKNLFFLYFFFIFLQKEAEQAKKDSDRTMEIAENGAHEQTAA